MDILLRKKVSPQKIMSLGQFRLASIETIVLSLQNCKLPTVNKFHVTVQWSHNENHSTIGTEKSATNELFYCY